MFISVMLKIFFEDGQYHNERTKLEFRINEICFGSMYNVHNFNLHGMLPLLLRFLLPATLKLYCFCFSFNNSSLFSQIYLKCKRLIIHRDNNCQTFMKVLYIFVLVMVLVCRPYLLTIIGFTEQTNNPLKFLSSYLVVLITTFGV